VTIARATVPDGYIVKSKVLLKHLSIAIKWDSWQYNGDYPLKDITAAPHCVIAIWVVEHLYDKFYEKLKLSTSKM